jgi:hypothetical protein
MQEMDSGDEEVHQSERLECGATNRVMCCDKREQVVAVLLPITFIMGVKALYKGAALGITGAERLIPIDF